MKRHALVVAALSFFPTLAAGQSPSPAAAAQSITEARIRIQIDRIAHDSMRGRATPSPDLDRAAAYVAAEFRRAGLVTTIQRYPLTRSRLVPGRSTVTLTGPEGHASLSLATDAALAQGAIPPGPIGGQMVILGGAVDPAAVVPDSVRGRAVLWLADFTEAGLPKVDGIAASLLKAGPALVLLVPNVEALVDQLASQQAAERVAPVGQAGLGFTAIAVRESAIAKAWPALGTRLAAARRVTGTLIESAAGITAAAALADSTLGTATAPNVIGLLRGTSKKGEYVAVSAHLDHLGVASGVTGDSIYNGADDNGSGSAGLLELARAFGRGPRPARSMVFVSVSGEEKGLWGSGYFVTHPTVPLSAVVADINMDMIGRNWRDTVGVIGREHSDLGQVLDSVAALHPELRMKPIGDVWPDQGRFYRSDHYNFARHGVPILFLSSGYAPEYHELGDDPKLIDAEKEARLVRLVYWFARAVADRTDRPKWNPESFRTIATER